jgi:hypothetical protein
MIVCFSLLAIHGERLAPSKAVFPSHSLSYATAGLTGTAAEYEPPPDLPEIVPCPGPNAYRTAWGYCLCEEGFSYGDPEASVGCWRCSPPCHINAVCVAPGVCHCQNAFKGDGVSSCVPIVPRILSIHPSSGFANAETTVNITYAWDVNLTFVGELNALCRFGLISIAADWVNQTMIVCRAMPRGPHSVAVGISFDGIHWSAEPFTFKYVETGRTVSSGLILFGVAAVIVIGIETWRIFGGSQAKEALEEGGEPFIGRADPEVVRKRKGGHARRRIET